MYGPWFGQVIYTVKRKASASKSQPKERYKSELKQKKVMEKIFVARPSEVSSPLE